MSNEEKTRIELGARSYDIVVSAGALQQLQQFEAFSRQRHLVVITDDVVATHYLPTVMQQLTQCADRVDSITVPAGETSKSIEKSTEIWNRLLEIQTDRHSVIVALGGGVVGDLAGFMAATFCRGIPFVQIPTSLLAQVDSSVGGKVGINLPGGKNLVGAFWQPEFVLIDPNVLTTLDDANYKSGLAEVVKYGVIMDAPFFQLLEENAAAILSRDQALLAKIILRCCQLKGEVVIEDESERTGRRAILNYGHTFGHAVENVFGYGSYLHGEAIAIGMQCAARLALEMGGVAPDLLPRQTDLLTQLQLPLIIEPGREEELVAAMYRDKKMVGGKLKLVLPTRIGAVELVDAPGRQQLIDVFSVRA